MTPDIFGLIIVLPVFLLVLVGAIFNAFTR